MGEVVAYFRNDSGISISKRAWTHARIIIIMPVFLLCGIINMDDISFLFMVEPTMPFYLPNPPCDGSSFCVQ